MAARHGKRRGRHKVPLSPAASPLQSASRAAAAAAMSYEKCNTKDTDVNPDDDGLEGALDTMGKPGRFLYMVFILCSIPGVFNIWHLTSYVFQGYAVDYWCKIPEFSNTNWTMEQIKNISMPIGGEGSSSSSCTKYDYSYKEFANLSYEQVQDKIASMPKPKEIPCDSYEYSDPYTITTEWDLVCDRAVLKSNTQMVVSLGKFLGALIFGFVADKWGRRASITTSCIFYLIAGPVAGALPYYYVFVIARLFIGMAGSGCYNCCFTVLTEVSHSSYRTLLGILYNMSYPVGLLLLPLLAYFLPDWQDLQLAISIPCVVLLLIVWLLPESPRWLISQGKREKAWKIVSKRRPDLAANRVELSPMASQRPAVVKEPENKRFYQHFLPDPKKFGALLVNFDMAVRLIICCLMWFVAALTYFALSLNADNFAADRYIYTAISGAVEAAGYLLPIPMLKYIGRRPCTALLFLISGISLLIVMAVPPYLRMAIAMVGRLCIGAVYSVVILYTSELFPTVIRSTAVGASSTMSHIGAIAAPYIVDLLGAQAWYIPSSLCAILSIACGIVTLLLPETKNNTLVDTIEEAKAKQAEGDRVALKNCLCC